MTRALRLFVLLLGLLPAVAQAQSNSKAVFEQARREPRGSARAIELYRRYVSMEPRDAWGHLALAEAHAAARNFDEAFTALKRAEQLAPGEEDVDIVRSRIKRAHRNSLPSIKPITYISRDTDENTATTLGAAADMALSTQARFGVTGSHTLTSDGVADATTDRAAATLLLRTPALRWNTEIGGARLAHEFTRNVPVAQTHLRWSPGARSVTADVRFRHTPVTSVYSLIASETMLSEARAVFDVPLGGHLKLRGAGQLGSIATTTSSAVVQQPGRGGRRTASQTIVDRNRRVGVGAALVTPLSSTSELALLGYRLSYAEAGGGFYFAPEHVDLIELGTYTEIYRFDPLTLAFDAGVGAQRAKPFGQPEGDVKPAYRLWAQLSAPLAEYLELSGEVDIYKSQLSTVTTSASWSSFAGGISLRWLIN